MTYGKGYDIEEYLNSFSIDKFIPKSVLRDP